MSDIEIEDVLNRAKFGLWNIKVLLLGLFGITSCSMSDVFMPLVYGDMNFKCAVAKANATIAKNQCSYVYQNSSAKCNQFEYMPGNFESTMVSKFDLVCDRAHLADYNSQILMIGQMISFALFSTIIDMIGRKTGLVISNGLWFVCSLMYFLAPSVEIALVIRFFEVMLISANFISCYMLIAESLPSKYRAIGTNSTENAFGIGLSISALISLLYSDWKFLVITRSLFPTLTLGSLGFLFLEESPKWLLRKRKYRQVAKVAKKVFELNKCEMPWIIKEQLLKLENKDCNKGIRFCKKFNCPPFWQLFRTKKTILWMVALSLNWIACVIVYYGLLFSPKLFNIRIQYYFLLCGFFTPLACLLQYILAHRFGRRVAMIVSLLLAGMCLISGVFSPNKGKLFFIRYIIACSSYLFITSGFITLYMWHSELMPSNLRAIGVGMGSITGRFAGIFISFIITFLSGIWSGLPVIFFAAVTLLSALFSLLIPETRGQLMPDDIEEYECYGTEKYTLLKKRRIELLQEKNETPI